MASSVFFKFKSSKEPQRITFDGTGISVFELKKDIISVSGLGDGTDFDLAIYNEDTNEEYVDDTEIIPRSTSVVARRLPASKPGHGKAARYVSGKMPVNAKNTHRVESSNSRPAIQGKAALAGNAAAEMDKAQTEEERIQAMFRAGADQWEQQQQQMANAKPVHRGGYKNKAVNVPDHEPPPGYICYRCHEKGHWIQACPTNDDPNFESRPRIKRTTGIPRSFLKTIEKPVALANDGLTDDTRQPSGVMVNAEGEYVIAEPDKASWEQFQAKAKASAAQQEAAATGNKELQDRGLECPIDRRLFVEPMKTPCCGKTYCNDCIVDALINNDLVCPNCSKPVLIDDLVSDEETIAKIKAYEEEKASERKVKESSKSPKAENATPAAQDDKTETNGITETKVQSPTPPKSGPSSPTKDAAKPEANSESKKRPAEEELKNDRIPTAPAAMRKQQQQQSANPMEQNFMAQLDAMIPPNMAMNPGFGPNNFFPNPGMNGMGFPGQNGMMGMPMSMPPMMGMPQGMMNPMMMQNGGAWQNMGGMGFPQQNGMYGQSNMMMGGGGGYGQQNWQGNQGWGMNGPNQQPHNMQNGKMGVFPNQQRTVFSEPFPNEEDNAYFRQPVNPHRHQNRQKRARPSDYREL